MGNKRKAYKEVHEDLKPQPLLARFEPLTSTSRPIYLNQLAYATTL